MYNALYLDISYVFPSLALNVEWLMYDAAVKPLVVHRRHYGGFISVYVA